MAETVKLIITADDAGAIKTLKDTNKQLKGIETQTGENTKTNKGLIGSLKSLKAGYIAMAAVVAGVVVKALKVGLKSASDFEEANSKFGVVFRGVSEEANAMRQELVDSYGVSTQAATEMLSGIQDFLVPMGIARGEAADLSGEFAKLAVDIGSFNNAPTAQVMEAMKSALAGQSEPLRRFGIDVSETTLKQMALAQGMELTNGKLDRQQRAQLILSKITRDSSDALGDFARTQDSMANVMKRAQAIFQDITLIFGQELARELGPLITKFGEFIKTKDGLFKIRKAIQGIFLAFKLLALPINFTIKPLIAGIDAILSSVRRLATAGKLLLERDFKGALEAAKEAGGAFVEPFVELGEGYKETANGIIDDFKRLVSAGEESTIEGVNNIVDANEEGNQRLEDNNKKRTQKKKKEKKKESVDLLGETSNFFGNLATLQEAGSKNAFAIGKGAAIAQTTVDTYSAAQKSYNALAGIPVVGPALGVAAAAAAITAGIVRISKIKSAKFQKAQRGGVIEPSFSGTPIIAGENNKREAIIPLEDDRLDEKVGGLGGGSPIINITFAGDVVGGDVDELSDSLTEKIDRAMYKLQQDKGSTFADSLTEQ
jgi:hypothetical protein